VEENRLLTVGEYMTLPPSVAEEFVKLWMKDNSGVCSRIMVDNLRNDVAALKASDRLGILTMFGFIVGNPANQALRAEFYNYLLAEEDYLGPQVTEANFFWEMEKSMKAFADVKRAETAWANRPTANAGPDCDQCGNARTGIGGRVCDMCDLAKQDPAIVHNHNHTICYCCVDHREDVPRRTYDDGFSDDYDGEDEGEEERRQEMAEENERQMEWLTSRLGKVTPLIERRMPAGLPGEPVATYRDGSFAALFEGVIPRAQSKPAAR
jgi:hypothetical protein